MSINEPDRTPPAETENLLAELNDLQEQQRKILDRAIYVGMTVTETQKFDRRAQRINELQRALGEDLTHSKPRPENPSE